MPATSKPLLSLTASDLMTSDVIRLAENLPLQDAASLLLKNRISGAPVVNAEGKCVGVFSAFDFLYLVLGRPDLARAESSSLSESCPFQIRQRRPDGAETTLCLLPPGVCPLQGKQRGPEGGTQIVCNEPHGVLTDWQVVEVDKLPKYPVGQLMTADPVTVTPATPIGVLARLLIDAHIHRVIVVDGEQRPVGMVSSTDVLAAVAYADREREAKECGPASHVVKRTKPQRSGRVGQRRSRKEMP